PAGEFDRHDTIVPVDLPKDLPAGIWRLKDPAGAIPLQVTKDGRGFFVLQDLNAGRARTLELEGPSAEPNLDPNGVRVEKSDDGRRLDVRIRDKSALQYQGKTDLPEGYDPQLLRAGYLHPI